MTNQTGSVIAGIDTHADRHHVAVIDEHGKPLADKEFLAVGSGYRKSVPKSKDGPVECLRILRAGRTSAVKARTAAINQIKGLLVSAPDNLRATSLTPGTSAW